LINITSKFFSFNMWEWFLHSSVLERIEFDFILLVPWGRFSLCHTPIRPISAFYYHISILIVACVITRFVSIGIRATLRNKVISFSYFCFFSVSLSFSVFVSFILLFLVSVASKQKHKRDFILLMSLIISVAYINKERLDEKQLIVNHMQTASKSIETSYPVSWGWNCTILNWAYFHNIYLRYQLEVQFSHRNITFYEP